MPVMRPIFGSGMRDTDQTLQQRFLSRARHIWRLAVPFWMFRDAGHGSAGTRRANYRYNRDHRKVLPFFLGKWSVMAFCLLQAMFPLSQLMQQVDPGSGAQVGITLLCMLNGIAFAFACVVITILLASYLYLTLVDD